jgi:hypothetical protein
MLCEIDVKQANVRWAQPLPIAARATRSKFQGRNFPTEKVA